MADYQRAITGCLIQNDVSPAGHLAIFDRLPAVVRQRVNDSPFKLCIACIAGASFNGRLGTPQDRMLAQIDAMEQAIRWRLSDDP